jgi:hypothetical protein
MQISSFEVRPDWKQIVESVPCPMTLIENGAVIARCGAEPGQPCRNVSSSGTLWNSQARVDWHQQRKEEAILVWQHLREKIKQVSSPVPMAGGHSAYTSRSMAIPAPIQQQFILSHQEVAHAIKEGKVEESCVGEYQGDGESGASEETGNRSQSEEGGQVKNEVTHEVDRA